MGGPPTAVWCMWTLLCLSSCLQRGVGLSVHALEGSVELAGKVALEDSSDLFGAASFCAASFDVGAGFWVVGHAGDDGHVQGAIDPPVTAPVQPVASGVP